MDKDSFLNFCMAMQCAEIYHGHVLMIIEELIVVADKNGFDKTVLEEMLKELNKNHD